MTDPSAYSLVRISLRDGGSLQMTLINRDGSYTSSPAVFPLPERIGRSRKSFIALHRHLRLMAHCLDEDPAFRSYIAIPLWITVSGQSARLVGALTEDEDIDLIFSARLSSADAFAAIKLALEARPDDSKPRGASTASLAPV